MAQPQSQIPQMPQMNQLPQAPQMSPQMSPQLGQLQQQHQMQQQQRPAFSPTQHSPSPTMTPQPPFAIPPNKRARTETGPLSQQMPHQQQQHQPAFHAQQYSLNTQNQALSPSATSPGYVNSPTSIHPQQNYASPYGNGGQPSLSMPTPTTTTTPLATPTLHMPEARQNYAHSPSISSAPVTPSQQYTNATMMPIAPPHHPPQGAMGPPSKPAERPTKEYEYDVSDSLAGTGIDLRAEEQALADFYAGSFAQEARTGLPANAPGGKASMYGAGWANQPAQPTDATQEQFAADAAKKAWDEAAQRLAISRSNEIREPFLQIATVHARAEKIAKEHGIGLNLDLRSNPALMGKLKAPVDFPQPKVTVSTKAGPEGTMVATSSSWIPHDAWLADQLALLSIATKHRLRELIEEAADVAINRQTTSNGEVPEEWAEVAVPLQTGLSSLPEPDSAVSPPTNPLKRSFDVANTQSPKSISSVTKNPLTKTMRDIGETDRRRMNPETPAAGARSGSAAPGTPGGAAPDEAKAPSKKELKKGAAAARIAEASSTASANQTLNTLIGGFGGRKKGKQYSWMTGGGSGASTPSRLNTPGTPGAATAAASAKPVQEQRLTTEGRTLWGKWRDSIMGRNIQLRDWVTALEMDGMETRTIQDAYMNLDASAK
ncbi:hypothetical protein B0T14DRAFT_511016 [Immersiella caudata]|uniref:Transcription initiation factor TFIID subunit 4 n=1 Tax=Immersiella caudata TaxID=314043 RepID=A0AA40C6D3_9PEZI|nr:hypothetical protein B0T14DRAFT_511016 [Immersiella caudata]